MLSSILIFVLGALSAAALRMGWSAFFSFRAQKSQTYASEMPVFDMPSVLNGELDATGVIFDVRGQVTSRFTARMVGTWQDGKGRLDEEFLYETGQTQIRAWNFALGAPGKFTATAEDIIGTAHGEYTGNTVRVAYRIRLPENAGGHVLDVVDWMYLSEDGVILNRSQFRKFGIMVAELFATMQPAWAQADVSSPVVATREQWLDVVNG